MHRYQVKIYLGGAANSKIFKDVDDAIEFAKANLEAAIAIRDLTKSDLKHLLGMLNEPFEQAKNYLTREKSILGDYYLLRISKQESKYQNGKIFVFGSETLEKVILKDVFIEISKRK